jgi:hypothetical protein
VGKKKDRERHLRLYEAAKRNDINTAQKLLVAGVNPNVRCGEFSKTAMEECRSIEMRHLLLAYNAMTNEELDEAAL